MHGLCLPPFVPSAPPSSAFVALGDRNPIGRILVLWQRRRLFLQGIHEVHDLGFMSLWHLPPPERVLQQPRRLLLLGVVTTPL
ncbi:hypothetical protein QR680_005787 [Steinernema hermaphroditum]|uniref:Uncharacterized protein n=1 Tax=Steinernema hermaphroditum TaxID=289476 RepID=A0AA39HTD6_9BILA|nr:hypothetical protein QR680_005787 [Steinernema hermaphroditum]